MSRKAIDPELLRRHAGFWDRSDSAVLSHRISEMVYRKRPFPLSDGTTATDPRELSADDVDLTRFVGIAGDSASQKPAAEETPPYSAGDLIGYAGPVFPEAWMSALLGCPIFASAFGCISRPVASLVAPAAAGSRPGAGMPAAEPTDAIWAAADAAARNYTSSPWFTTLRRMLAVAVSAGAESGAPVRQPHLRGVVDMMAAFLGEKRLCLEAFDHPDLMQAMAIRFAEMWIDVARATGSLRPAWNGGSVSCWKLYSDQMIADYQIDASSILSPDLYRQIFLGADERVFQSFPRSIVHLHAVGLHMLDLVLETRVSAIQLQLDRETGEWDRAFIISCCQKVQQAGKGLIVVGELSDQDLHVFLTSLDHRGLALDSWAESVVAG